MDIRRTNEEEMKMAGIKADIERAERVIENKFKKIDEEIERNKRLQDEKSGFLGKAKNIREDITKTSNSIRDFLLEKNKRYGNSALKPLEIFKNIMDKEDFVVKGMLIRISDKLKRIENSDTLRKNDVSDLIGYLILICVKKGWTDFLDQVD